MRREWLGCLLTASVTAFAMGLAGQVAAPAPPDAAHVRIPDEVAPREYQVYSAWLDYSLGQDFHDNLSIVAHTKAFNPLIFPCHKPALYEHSNDAYIHESLAKLGDQTFPLDLGKEKSNLRTSIPYTVISKLPKIFKDQTLMFSRVAFSDDGSGGVFSVSTGKSGDINAKVDLVWALMIDGHWKIFLLC
jgi:hypothetical protein